MARRAVATFWSNTSTMCLWPLRMGVRYGSSPGGLKSHKSCVSVPSTQPGISARCEPTQPIVFDFGCAFQSSLVVGNSLDRFPRAGHFQIELGQNGLGDAHG